MHKLIFSDKTNAKIYISDTDGQNAVEVSGHGFVSPCGIDTTGKVIYVADNDTLVKFQLTVPDYEAIHIGDAITGVKGLDFVSIDHKEEYAYVTSTHYGKIIIVKADEDDGNMLFAFSDATNPKGIDAGNNDNGNDDDADDSNDDGADDTLPDDETGIDGTDDDTTIADVDDSTQTFSMDYSMDYTDLDAAALAAKLEVAQLVQERQQAAVKTLDQFMAPMGPLAAAVALVALVAAVVLARRRWSGYEALEEAV